MIDLKDVQEAWEPMDLTAYEPYKEQFRSWYVGNECGSDEYRETQPGKGLLHAANAMDLLETGEEQVELLKLVRDWINAIENQLLHDKNRYGWRHVGYCGAEELQPVLARVFDILWAHGEHPYYTTKAELDEQVEFLKDNK